MPFRTKIDFSDNRQVSQRIETIQILSGATSFGVTFNDLPTGPDLTTSAVTQTYNIIPSTFSGNSGTTIYTWYDSRMSLGESGLSPITPSNSGTTQDSGPWFTANTFNVIDGNTIATTYTGVSFNILVSGMTDLGGGNYSGDVVTNTLDILSANTLDFTGRTIWVDTSGITRTERLIVTNNPQVGYVLKCIDSEGMAEWAIDTSGATALTYWSASTNGIVVKNSNSLASGLYSLAEGNGTTASGSASHAEGESTLASGNIGSHAEGVFTKASGQTSHAEGANTTASGDRSHSEGNTTIASGNDSHAEGISTTASNQASHSEGSGTTASGIASHAGGQLSIASGNTSFVHGSGSTAGGIGTVVLGNGITGLVDNTTYVPNLNISIVGAGPGITDLGIDANGNVVDQASDISLKENIKTISNALNTVLNLRGVTYNWKDKEKGGESLKLGFIAQEVNSVIPELVYNNSINQYMGVHYKDFPALIVEAIKELATGLTRNNTYLETQTILAEDNNIDLNYNGTKESAIGGGIRVLKAIDDNLHSELITDKDGNWVTNSDFKSKSLTIPFFTPTESNDNSGSEGNITRDNNYLYLKGIDKWKRIKLEDF